MSSINQSILNAVTLAFKHLLPVAVDVHQITESLVVLEFRYLINGEKETILSFLDTNRLLSFTTYGEILLQRKNNDKHGSYPIQTLEQHDTLFTRFLSTLSTSKKYDFYVWGLDDLLTYRFAVRLFMDGHRMRGVVFSDVAIESNPEDTPEGLHPVTVYSKISQGKRVDGIKGVSEVIEWDTPHDLSSFFTTPNAIHLVSHFFYNQYSNFDHCNQNIFVETGKNGITFLDCIYIQQSGNSVVTYTQLTG